MLYMINQAVLASLFLVFLLGWTSRLFLTLGSAKAKELRVKPTATLCGHYLTMFALGGSIEISRIFYIFTSKICKLLISVFNVVY
jgi:hypothetical protein